MSQTANILHLAAHEMGERVAAWLRQVYPDARAKRIGRDFDVSEATAKRWLSGVRPTSDYLNAMTARWGWRFTQMVFQAQPRAAADDDLRAELAIMRATIERLEARLAGSDTKTTGEVGFAADASPGATGRSTDRAA